MADTSGVPRTLRSTKWCAAEPGSICARVPALRRSVARCTASGTLLQHHHDLAEVLVGFHVRERTSDLGKGKDLVDRQLQFSRFHRRPDIFPDLVKDFADFLDGAGTEGDADILDAARGVQVEIEIAMGAAEPADIDDAALDFG